LSPARRFGGSFKIWVIFEQGALLIGSVVFSSLKIGDTIKVLEKDYPFEGQVSDLTDFFVHLKTTSGEINTIPNSLIFQKAVLIVTKKEETKG
jgi:small-conductance mechanosensitive channel